MMKPLILLVIFLVASRETFSQAFSPAELSRWKGQADQVTIHRDKYGVPHVYGKTDADAVFGLMYAQAEDDFTRVELNYITMLGRLAEVKGENSLYADLQMRMLIDSAAAVKDYIAAPQWLRKLLISFADGLNYYIYKHPGQKPLLLTRYKPWYPLLWTDGSINAINTAGVTATEFRNFYDKAGGAPLPPVAPPKEPGGSNGFAFAPSVSTSGHAMIYINPHVDFYFRPEVHMSSEEGLNVYGAVTWGQFFVYQGFNKNCGWMHTSGDADNADLYREKINGMTYSYDGKSRQVIKKNYTLYYTTPTGKRKKILPAYFTHHGPVITSRNGEWLALKANNRSMNGLIESWMRTKAKGFSDYKKSMKLVSNATNNTVYADAAGNIAYWHGNFVPYRDSSYDWSKPVDGSTSRTEWLATHNPEDLVYVFNPPNGWLQNCNSSPFAAAGQYSPQRRDYIPYLAPGAENFRSINAVKILSGKKKYSMQDVIDIGYNTHLAAFDSILPALHNAYYSNAEFLREQWDNEALALLDSWDRDVSENSVALTVAISFAEKITPFILAEPLVNAKGFVGQVSSYLQHAQPQQLVSALHEVLMDLNARYGTWKMPWGDINRIQRLESNPLVKKFNDSLLSYPVAFASSQWGMLPSFVSTRTGDNQKRYGIAGNSFICVVEFGPKIKARSLLAGGESGDAASTHFFDQGLMYSKGRFKDVLFYKEDVLQGTMKSYHPGKE